MTELFLRECWYQIAFADEVSTKPLARTILNTGIVLFRSKDQIVALRDMCPHRNAPLSLGQVTDGTLVCGYHGLTFNGTGQCVHNPHGRISRNMSVTAYTVVERHDIAWIWMGTPENADPSLIPNLSFIDNTPRTAQTRFYIPVRASYRLVNDNLLDLSHADYLHPTSLGGVMTGAENTAKKTEDVVVVEWINSNIDAPPRFHNRVPPPQKADSWTQATWHAPAIMVIGTALSPTGKARQPIDEIWALHSMTPETETTTHYFVCGTRKDRTGDLEYSEKLKGMLSNAFENEDRPMLEAQQAAISAEGQLKPVVLGIDKGLVLVRQELDKRIAQETAGRNN